MISALFNRKCLATLLLIYYMLNLADIWTTRAALAAGHMEGNPLIASVIDTYWFMLVKIFGPLAIIVFVWFRSYKSQKSFRLAITVAIVAVFTYSVIVMNNGLLLIDGLGLFGRLAIMIR